MLAGAALRDLFAHMDWADAAVWRVVSALVAAAPDARLRDLLLHLHVVQRAFLHVWTGRELTFPEPAEFADLPALMRWAHPVYADLHAFVEAVDAGALGRPVLMPWVAEYEQRTGRRFASPTLAETMFQVTSHTTYHRGQVNARLRELGAEPPLVDYIAWIWFGRPAPEWPPAPTVGPGARPAGS